jgi:regulator of sirC expression with transglutaminase-like and TPR domain
MQSQLERIETNEGLLGGALAIALHAAPDLEPERVEIELDRISETIRGRLHGEDPRAIVAHAHALLFDEMGFRGAGDDYYDPRNSHLPEVLARRRGLPITLALVYKLVVEPLGPRVRGISAPGHFLARVEGGRGFTPMLVDVFAGGRVLSVPEAVARVREVTGDAFPIDAEHLPLATHREWLQRMLRNLIGVYHVRGLQDDRAAMEELSRLLGGAA